MISKKNICYAHTIKEHKYSYLDLYLPNDDIRAVFVYFHLGGIEGGSKNETLEPLNLLTEKGIAVVYADYRLYPDASYPDFITDAAEAVDWVMNHLDIFRNCKNIFIGGSSAGSYLAMMLYFNKSCLAKYGLSCKDFSGFIFDAGQPTAHYNVLRERNIDSRKAIIDETVPMYYIEEYSKEPPVLILVADHDLPCRYEQNMLLISTMKNFNYPENIISYRLMENSEHCSYNQDSEFGDIVLNFIDDLTVV